MIRQYFASLGVLLTFLTLFVLAGCGGSGGSASTGTPSISISAPVVPVRPGQTAALTAFVRNSNDTVVWSVDGTGTGSITSSGTYTAPLVDGVYTVRAHLSKTPTVEATAAVTVSSGITVSIALPVPNPVVVPRSRLKFSAAVGGSSNQTVTWSVAGGTATISPTGVFTAPDTLGDYTITATSYIDGTKSASITVSVVANASVRITVAGKGDVVLGLRPDKAPNTVANFVSLVNQGFYDGIVFHRYVADFVIQGGDPLTKTLPLDDALIGTGDPGYTIPFEANDLTHTVYALAMARKSGLDTAGSQFYITLSPQPSLDGDYCVYGSVLSGTSVVDSLRRGDVITRMRTETPAP